MRIFDIGSWTDTPSAEHGAVLTCAIDCAIHVTLRNRQRGGHDVQTHYGVLPHGQQARPVPFENDFFRLVLDYFNSSGIDAEVTGDVPPGFGLGGTAAVAVALTAAVGLFAGKSCTPHQLASIAHQLYLELMGRPYEMQGFLSAAIGGIALQRLTPYPRVFVQSVPLSEEVMNALEQRLLVILTGRPARRDAYHLLETRISEGGRAARESLWQLRSLPSRAVHVLRQGNFEMFGGILREQHALQRRLCPGVFSPEIWHLEAMALRHGAYGVKLNGMGGSVTVLSPPHQRGALEQYIRAMGYQVLTFKLDRCGLRLWREEPRGRTDHIPVAS